MAKNNSISTGQVLKEPTDYETTKLIVWEMADVLSLDLVEKGLVTDQIVLTVNYENLAGQSGEYKREVTLDWYGKHQPEEDAICPRCGELMPGATSRHALSRWASITVCDQCGTIEALEQAGLTAKKPLMKWAAIEGPQAGKGAWRG